MRKIKIILVIKDDLNRRPPILSVCEHLSSIPEIELGIVAVTMNQATRDRFEHSGVEVFLTGVPHKLPVPGKLEKLRIWRHFRRMALSYIKRSNPDYLWLGSADAAMALGESELSNYRYVLQVQELYDLPQHERYRKALSHLMPGAVKVVVPEEGRAHIFRAWFNLRETPEILPNKPSYHPRQSKMAVKSEEIQTILGSLPDNAKLILYQGIMGRERNLEPLLEAVESLGAPWYFAVQCHNEYARELEPYKARYRNFIHIPYLPAPDHLSVTSHAYIGAVTYEHHSLNTEFCAPNKIWEYSGFGLPMIGSDVLGLKYTIERSGCGVCLNFSSISSGEIKDILLKIDADYDKLRNNAEKFFNSCNNFETVKKICAELGAE